MSIFPRLLHFILKLLFFFSQISLAIDTITQLQPLPDDGTTLVSKTGIFELGFFSPGNSPNRYVGIWYKNIPVRRAVWVANRDNPIKDNSSQLIINQEGNLVLLNQNNSLLWSTNKTTTTNTNASSLIFASLLDTGNLVLSDNNNTNKEEEEASFLWQSFDHPCDTVLPGMKVGWDRKTGINELLIAWRNWDDPSPGDLTSGILLTNNPETGIWKNSSLYYRSGPATGAQTSQIVGLQANPVYNYTFFHTKDEVYYMFTLINSSVISIVVLNQTLSSRQRLTWVPQSNAWTLYNALPVDSCDVYNVCGVNGNCVLESPICQCLDGFEPKSPAQWNTLYWASGCVRSPGWECRVKDKDGFRRVSRMKVPDTTYYLVNESMTLEDCRVKCLENCNCTAYSSLDPSGERSGCSMWFGNLFDLRVSQSGQDLYVRTVPSDSDAGHGNRKIALEVSIPVSLVVVALLAFYIYRTKIKRKDISLWLEEGDEDEHEDMELPFYDLATILNATKNFSNDNKLGEGGFGPVYKGTLQDEQEIAVKRLSKSSGQGLVEFKNEIILCAKLQHRNLVKVIGFCVEGDEKMLLYEYMPNKSLDSFIFDPTQRKLLNWSKRFNILHGIARGLLYLHQDSRLRIIHRDLKASNVLLDNDMNPKISDFGIARMCGEDQIEGRTRRIAGTYGYMAPEYAIDGLFSIKSDVFSFGVLLLEIVSGKKNKGVTYQDEDFNLIAHAWRLWNENTPQKLVDDYLRDSYNLSEALRCIQIGLLCLQHHPHDWPNMTSVVVMLSSENALPQPKDPGFLIRKISNEEEDSSKGHTSSSVNKLTISVIKPR